MDNLPAPGPTSGTLGDMSYHDLPADLRSRPLTDPALGADVIDLVVDPDTREGGALALMLCDENDHGIQPFLVDGVPADADPTTVGAALRALLSVVADHDGSVLVARGRPGGILLTDADREWHQAVIEECRAAGTRLLGAFLATPAGVRAFPEGLRLVS